MKRKHRKIQKTIRCEPAVIECASKQAKRLGLPEAVVLANAAKVGLLGGGEPATDPELAELRQALLARMARLEDMLRRDLFELRELVAILTRTYLNHTPDIPGEERESASMSGRHRFTKLRELVHRNVTDGTSILDAEASANGH